MIELKKKYIVVHSGTTILSKTENEGSTVYPAVGAQYFETDSIDKFEQYIATNELKEKEEFGYE